MKTYLENPFQFEGIVTGSNFCDRDEDINELLEYMHSGNNVIISMKRRVGKSSIIKEIFKNHIKDKRALTAYIDIYGITSKKELYLALKEEVENICTVSFKIGVVANRLSDAFSEAIVKTDIGKSSRISIEFAGNNYELLIKKLLQSLEAYAVASKIKIVLAIDEFQKIASLKKEETEAIETNIRSAMQTCKHISFVISGSNQTLLDNMFKEEKPLYRQGAHHTLEPISEDVFYKWVNKKFEKKEITFSKEGFSYLYRIANTEAKIIQQVCFKLFGKMEPLSNIGVSDVKEILIKIYKSNSEIMSKFNNLKLTEQKMMKVIAIEREAGITVSPLLEEYGVNHGSVNGLLVQMQNSYHIAKLSTGKYEIVDTELKLWILVDKGLVQEMCDE
jgi:hypothetical protein